MKPEKFLLLVTGFKGPLERNDVETIEPHSIRNLLKVSGTRQPLMNEFNHLTLLRTEQHIGKGSAMHGNHFFSLGKQLDLTLQGEIF